MGDGAKVDSQAQQDEFEIQWSKWQRYVAMRARIEARRANMAAEDADDIAQIASIKLYNAYFASHAKQRYRFQSDTQDLALLRRIVASARADLARRERADRKFLATLSLDDLVYRGGDTNQYLTECEALTDGVSAEDVALANVNFISAVKQKLQTSRTPGNEMVMGYMMAECTREKVEEYYDDNYINVTTHHLKRHISRCLMSDD